MKILHVAESSRGGCGTYLNEIVPLQAGELGSANVRLIAPDRHLLQFEDVAPEIIFSFKRRGRVLGLVFLAAKLIRTIRDFQPDIIHAHSTFAGGLVRLLSVFIPHMPATVYCPHGWVFDTTRSPTIRKIMEVTERSLSRRCVAVVCVSEAERAAGKAAGIFASKLFLVLNGVRKSLRTDAVAEWLDPRLKVLFVGRLDRQKGVDILLSAVRPLEESVSVRIIGESVLTNSDTSRHCDFVEYLGWLDQEAVGSYMRACDVVVMPSRWEGFGLVAIEAMRLGKPVIASAVGGLLEIIVDGQTGRLIPTEDPFKLREVLLEHSLQSYNEMGEAGRKRFLALYSIERAHKQLLSLYNAVLTRQAHTTMGHTNSDMLPVIEIIDSSSGDASRTRTD